MRVYSYTDRRKTAEREGQGMDCLFCSIVNGEIPSKKVYEDADVLAFYDIAPQAPVHIILIPKAHVMSCMDDITPENAEIVGKLMLAAAKIAKQLQLNGGYRLINNCGGDILFHHLLDGQSFLKGADRLPNGEDAGQTVQHLHFHLLAGEKLGEKLV